MCQEHGYAVLQSSLLVRGRPSIGHWPAHVTTTALDRTHQVLTSHHEQALAATPVKMLHVQHDETAHLLIKEREYISEARCSCNDIPASIRITDGSCISLQLAQSNDQAGARFNETAVASTGYERTRSHVSTTIASGFRTSHPSLGAPHCLTGKPLHKTNKTFTRSVENQ